MKKTKIIATLGPSTDDPKIMEKLIDAGVDIFRVNFSHATDAERKLRFSSLRKIEKELKRPITILADLQGPKVRVGELPEGGIELTQDEKVILTVEKPKKGEIPVQYKGLARDAAVGEKVLLDDGTLEVKVISKSETKLKCKVVTGGTLLSNKGINLTSSSISLPALSDKDKEDLKYALDHDADYIALSFVKSEEDVWELKRLIKQAGKNTKVISKIERHEAVINMDGIVRVSDAVMVARGDLGIEVSLASVPLLQKDIIKKCNAYGKPVIVATQMLDSMIRNPNSTRAETSDIANAILDGADAVMLSGETSVGKYPINAVRAMRKIALTVEKWSNDVGHIIGEHTAKNIDSTSEAIGKSASKLSSELRASVIINATAAGRTTRNVARFRPHCPIISVTHTQKTARELNLVWGVYPCVLNYKTVREMSLKSTKIAKDLKLVKKGSKIIIISGERVGVEGGTNMIKVKEV